MSIYDMRDRNFENDRLREAARLAGVDAVVPEVPAPVPASDVAHEVPVGTQVFLAHEYYSPADASLQVFQVLGPDDGAAGSPGDSQYQTQSVKAVNVDTGALRIIDVDELVRADDPSDTAAAGQ